MKVINYRGKNRKLSTGAILTVIGDKVTVEKSGSDWITSGTTIYEKRRIKVPKELFKDVKVVKSKTRKNVYIVVE